MDVFRVIACRGNISWMYLGCMPGIYLLVDFRVSRSSKDIHHGCIRVIACRGNISWMYLGLLHARDISAGRL